MEQTKKSFLQIALIGAKLLLICAIVAGVVSFVNAVTAKQSAENEQKTIDHAIGAIFNLEQTPPTEQLFPKTETVAEKVYRVFDQNGVVIGYCVEVMGGGFGGDIKLMVGYNQKCEILGVKVIAHSETPGLGAKIQQDASFLQQFIGKADELILSKDSSGDVQAIGGATVSSKAVTDAVNRASDSLQRVLSDGNGGSIR